MAETQEQSQQVVNMTMNDLIYAQVKDLGKRIENTRQDLNQRVDEISKRMDRLEEKIDSARRELTTRMDKQDDKIERLADKIDAMHNELKSSTGHISIANISTVAIAVGVLYSIFSK